MLLQQLGVLLRLCRRVDDDPVAGIADQKVTVGIQRRRTGNMKCLHRKLTSIFLLPFIGIHDDGAGAFVYQGELHICAKLPVLDLL